MTAELNLPVGTRITVHAGTTADLDIVAVPAKPKETGLQLPKLEATIHIRAINKHGTVEWTLNGEDRIQYSRAGDAITVGWPPIEQA